jgi:hypothetical protein
MATSRKQSGTDTPVEGRDEEAEYGRPAPIDEDVEGELNAALPEPPEQEKKPRQGSS